MGSGLAHDMPRWANHRPARVLPKGLDCCTFTALRGSCVVLAGRTVGGGAKSLAGLRAVTYIPVNTPAQSTLATGTLGAFEPPIHLYESAGSPREDVAGNCDEWSSESFMP
ncbi:unnamed protein product, partial [Iphiclides podalirius]